MCNAYLLSTRRLWTHVAASDAEIMIKCWRCERINLIRPEK